MSTARAAAGDSKSAIEKTPVREITGGIVSRIDGRRNEDGVEEDLTHQPWPVGGAGRMLNVLMRFLVLATDYDGTLAHHGAVDAATRESLERVRATGRKLVLVTGREIPDLEKTFAACGMPIDLFDSVVAENGALVYQPATKHTRLIGEPPPPAFAAALRARGVGPISEGQVIVATWEPHETA